MAAHQVNITDRLEQLTVQLAGCSAAALGATKDPAIRGQWGWSPAYQDVLDLRLKYEALLKAEARRRAPLEGSPFDKVRIPKW